MNNKIKLIDGYIEKCKKCKLPTEAENLIEEIIGVFNKEIEDITLKLDSYDMTRLYGDNTPINYIGDINLLKAKLENYKATLEYELEKAKKTDYPLVSVQQNSNINISIDFDQTITSIESIPNDILSQEEKEQIEGKLSGLKTEQDKSALWSRVQGILKWLADKSIDVGIASLPYIVDRLKK